jgi:hypothetical protein
MTPIAPKDLKETPAEPLSSSSDNDQEEDVSMGQVEPVEFIPTQLDSDDVVKESVVEETPSSSSLGGLCPPYVPPLNVEPEVTPPAKARSRKQKTPTRLDKPGFVVKGPLLRRNPLASTLKPVGPKKPVLVTPAAVSSKKAIVVGTKEASSVIRRGRKMPESIRPTAARPTKKVVLDKEAALKKAATKEITNKLKDENGMPLGRKYRFKQNTILLRKMRDEQKKAHLKTIIPKTQLRLLFQEACQKAAPDGIRIKATALHALHLGVEDFLHVFFTNASYIMNGSKNQVLLPRHIQILKKLKYAHYCLD